MYLRRLENDHFQWYNNEETVILSPILNGIKESIAWAKEHDQYGKRNNILPFVRPLKNFLEDSGYQEKN